MAGLMSSRWKRKILSRSSLEIGAILRSQVFEKMSCWHTVVEPSVSRAIGWNVYDGLPDTSATTHFGIKTLWDTSAPDSRHFDAKNAVRDTSTRVPWSRKSRDTSTQDNSDETQLHRWFVLNLKLRHQFCGAEVSCGRSIRLPYDAGRSAY